MSPTPEGDDAWQSYARRYGSSTQTMSEVLLGMTNDFLADGLTGLAAKTAAVSAFVAELEAKVEALEAAASVPPPSADAMKVLVRTMVEDVDLEMSSDLGSCAYYLRCQKVEGYEDGICTFGCREEPSCITDEPADGWPSSAPDFDYRRAWADSFTEYLLANVAAVPSSQEPTE